MFWITYLLISLRKSNNSWEGEKIEVRNRNREELKKLRIRIWSNDREWSCDFIRLKSKFTPTSILKMINKPYPYNSDPKYPVIWPFAQYQIFSFANLIFCKVIAFYCKNGILVQSMAFCIQLYIFFATYRIRIYPDQ